MIKNQLQAVILAAGKSTRFKSNKSKLLEKICGQAMILYPVKLLEQLATKITLVVGYQKEQLTDLLEKYQAAKNSNSLNSQKLNLEFVTQAQQLGTGHALLCTQDNWDSEHILILNGDVPLISADLIEKLYQQHLADQATVSFVIAHNIDPTINTLGKILKINQQIKIIEAKDYAQNQAYYQSATDPDTDGCCINVGIYLFKTSFLRDNIQKLQSSSVTGELYITDLVNLASEQNLKVSTITGPFDTLRGINTMYELGIAEQLKRAEIINYWMDHGVRFSMPQNTHIDLDVSIGAGSYIGAGVEIHGNSKIGQACNIASFCIIEDSVLADQTELKPFSYLQKNNYHNLNLGSKTKLSLTKKTRTINKNKTVNKHQKDQLGDNFVAAKKTDNIYQT